MLHCYLYFNVIQKLCCTHNHQVLIEGECIILSTIWLYKSKSMNQKRVFISYAHKDNQCALGISSYLKRHGFDVWMDVSNLNYGTDWARTIDDAIKNTDIVIGLLSSNAVERPEVIRELNLAIKRFEEDEDYKVIFVLVGKIHKSWFDTNDENTKKVIEHLYKYQFVQLNSRGDLTINVMNDLYNALIKDMLITDNPKAIIAEDYYTNNNTLEKAYDNEFDVSYYKTSVQDLSKSCAYLISFDNQYLPAVFEDENQEYYSSFLKKGFSADDIKDYLYEYQKKNLLLALMNFRQIVLNRHSVFSNAFFQRMILDDNDEFKESFCKLLDDGTFLLYLYRNNEKSPCLNNKKVNYYILAEKWNEICRNVDVHCLRENWYNTSDMHSVDLLKYLLTFAVDSNVNNMIAASFHLNQQEANEFKTTLKNAEMMVFCQTHMNGTKNIGKVEGYSRSNFYSNFITKIDENYHDNVHCVFDTSKPFCRELKKMVDTYYNSMFVNYLNCIPVYPIDAKAEDSYIQYLYVKHGTEVVDIEEIKYAFSEILLSDRIMNDISKLGENIFLKNWDIKKILALRKNVKWNEYIDFREKINKNVYKWKSDFSDAENLISKLANCIDGDASNQNKASFSFRLIIGSKVIDIVKTPKICKFKEYDGEFNVGLKNPLIINFALGDLTASETPETVFNQIMLFNGCIDDMTGNDFVNSFKNFLIKSHQCYEVE